MEADIRSDMEPDFNRRSVNYYVDTHVDGIKSFTGSRFAEYKKTEQAVKYLMDMHYILHRCIFMVMDYFLRWTPYVLIYDYPIEICAVQPIMQNKTNHKSAPININCGSLGIPVDVMDAVTQLPFMSGRVGRFCMFLILLLGWLFTISMLSSLGSVFGIITVFYILMYAVWVQYITRNYYSPAWPMWSGMTKLASGRALTPFQRFRISTGKILGSTIYAFGMLLLAPVISFQWVAWRAETDGRIVLSRRGRA